MLLQWRKPPGRPDFRRERAEGRICRNCLSNRHAHCKDDHCTCIHKEPWRAGEQERVETRIRHNRRQGRQEAIRRVAQQEKEMLEQFFNRSA